MSIKTFAILKQGWIYSLHNMSTSNGLSLSHQILITIIQIILIRPYVKNIFMSLVIKKN